jgi:hypothetical protein
MKSPQRLVDISCGRIRYKKLNYCYYDHLAPPCCAQSSSTQRGSASYLASTYGGNRPIKISSQDRRDPVAAALYEQVLPPWACSGYAPV